MPSKGIVDSQLFVHLDLSDTRPLNRSFGENRANLAHLASQLLLYERVFIPTYDYGILPSLVSWTGPALLQEMLDCGAIGFIRRRGLLGYVGNGNAISTFGIEAGDQRLLEWQEAMFADNQRTAELQLGQLDLPGSHHESLLDTTLQQTFDLNYTNEFFIEQIANETYRNVMNTPLLAQFVVRSTRRRAGRGVDLRWLPEVGGDQMRVLRSDGQVRDSVDLVLRAAEINMELLMANQAGGADLFTAEGAESLLRGKLARAGATPEMLAAFLSLLELNSIPDIRPAVTRGEVSFDDVWNLRNTPEGARFRDWLRVASPNDARELEKAFVEAISKKPLSSKWPIRAMRFAVTTAVGLIPGLGGLLAGTSASAIDSFVLDKLMDGYSPKLFLDEYNKLVPGRRTHGK